MKNAEIVEFYKKRLSEVKCKKQAAEETLNAFNNMGWVQVINPILTYNNLNETQFN